MDMYQQKVNLSKDNEIISVIPKSEIPSRPYYTTHAVHIEQVPNHHYSESFESIRSRSLELGNLFMKELNKSPLEQKENPYQNNNQLISRISPTSQKNTQSILTNLLKQDNHSSPSEHEALIQPDSYIKNYHAADTRLIMEFSNDSGSSAETLSAEEDDHLKSNNKSWTDNDVLYSSSSSSNSSHEHFVKALFEQPKTWLTCLPAVALGLLLNLLDAISYGLIIFPLNNPIFSSFGGDGVSMFFASCIISQIVYSCGSRFEGGNGSMMIEIVPFLHTIVKQIINVVGQENPETVIATTMVSFALSSILTGLAFFLLGKLKLGTLIGFFPRHILVGTIGGVGLFLVTTGIEISSRLHLRYDYATFEKLFLDKHIFFLWFTSLAAALVLRLIQFQFTNSSTVVPTFFIVLPLAFYYIILFVCNLDVQSVRDAGWIFPMVESDTPFWHFYTYYNWKYIDWQAVMKTIPATLALIFFGVLHVPINVPALEISTGKDNVSLDRELIVHGISNALAGLLGTVQNYLVYTNSILFIRSGGDSRLAGFLLSLATIALWMTGPWIVGYVPVIVVASLILHLGLDLLKEALIDTYHSVHYLEYITICVIIGCMGALGFIQGILVGFILGCVFFVVQNARQNQTIRSTFTGKYMRSTVRRHYRQDSYLSLVGDQIQVIKLQGYLFFGTINQVEQTIRRMLDESTWKDHPIRFLILDFQLVQGVDFSAAVAFVRIRQLLSSRRIFMIICNVTHDSDEGKALQKAGVWPSEENDDVLFYDQSDLKCFEYTNEAIEWCENVLLQTYFDKNSGFLSRSNASTPPMQYSQFYSNQITHVGSPRHTMLASAVSEVFLDTGKPMGNNNLTQPTLLLLQAFGDTSNRDLSLEYFHSLSAYFERCAINAGQWLYTEGENSCDYLVVLEQGSLQSHMIVLGKQTEVETIIPGTVVGELGMFLSSNTRTRSLLAVQNSVYWKLSRCSFERMRKNNPEMANQFIILTLYFSSQRLDTMTRHAFHYQ